MSDLVKRLRNYTRSFPDLADVAQAADEIERLKADFKTAFDEAWKRGCEIERLQKRNALLEDVAVAAEGAVRWYDGDGDRTDMDYMSFALDKLREVSDE